MQFCIYGIYHFAMTMDVMGTLSALLDLKSELNIEDSMPTRKLEFCLDHQLTKDIP